MKKEIRVVDKDKGILRCTTTDERWYSKPGKDLNTGLPTYQHVPSVTWIAGFYPKGIGFYKWLADKGWDEAEAIKEAAGDKGSKVHAAIAGLMLGDTVKIDSAYLNPSIGIPELLTLEEYQCIMAFAAWYTTAKPKIIAQDIVVWNDTEGYAGTIDLICEIAGVLYIVDFKTSKYIWVEHKIQLSAYKHADIKYGTARLAILQVGYPLNKLGYKFTEIEDCYDLFLASKRIWANETKGQQPLQRDYPLEITLPKEVVE